MNKRITILLLKLFLIQFLLLAQNNYKQFYRLIPSNQQTRRCFSITKTNDGFIWYVTEDGVNRFDGKFTKSYPVKINWRGILQTNSKGELFLGTSEGVGYKYNESKDCFDLLFMVAKNDEDDNVESGIPIAFKSGISPNITSMGIDAFDQIWLGTSQGPVAFIPKTKVWKYTNVHNLNNSFILVQDNKLYAFTPKGINYFDISSNNQTKISFQSIKNSQINSEITSAFFEKITGNLYIGTQDKGLFYLTKAGELKNPISLTTSPIRSVKMYDKNILLVGFDGLGIYEYDIYAEKIVNHYLVDENKVGSLGSNAVYEIFVDADKRIWVANYTTGIDVYAPNIIDFTKFTHILNNDNSLDNNNVLSIVEDKFKNLWFGTYNGLSVKKKSDGWAHFLVNNSVTQTNRYINTLCIDYIGNVWAGGAFGLQSFNPSSFQSKPLAINNKISGSVSQDIIHIISEDKSIWAVGLHTDLIQFNLLDKTQQNYKSKFIRCIENYDENHLLLLSYNKIFIFNKSTGLFDMSLDSIVKNFTKKRDPQYLSFRQKNDNIWIASRSIGLIKYVKSTNSVFIYNKETGLPSNRILSFEIDNNECLWLGTDEGLCYFNPFTKVVIPLKAFSESEKGLFNINASTQLDNGNLIFGTKEGAISFDPLKMFVSPNRGNLSLTDFSFININNDSRKFEEISQIPLNKCNKIVLRHYENNFTLKFEELIYGHTVLPRYSYRLDGYEKNFSHVSTQGSASYSGLRPGKYTLEIHSYFADTEGKFIERTVEIIIQQPWYNTFWAWILWVLIIAGIAIALYRYSKHRLDIRYSNEKISFFTNVSHDMRTPITLIKAPLGDLLLDESLSPSSRYLVQMINNNINRLFDMINRVLDFEKIDQHEMKLKLEEFDLNSYINDIVENFTQYAEINALKIVPVFNDRNLSVYFDKEKMDMIIDNLISNSIKYSITGGLVKVIVGNDVSKWWIEVSDNGIGIPKNEQKKIFNRFYRAENAINSKKIGSGMGLLLVSNLTQFMGGNVSFESQEGVNTIFRVSFPFTEAYRKANGNQLTINAKLDQNIEKVHEENGTPVMLFVDDNDEIRSYISTRLSADFQILTAESAAQAWSILQHEKVNIIITDIMMPEVSGIELCEKIKSDSSYAHIPVVLLSALSDKTDIIKGLQIGADDYITKPFDSVVLKQRIENILKNRKRLTKYLLNHKEDFVEINKQPFVSEMDKLFLEKLERTFNLNIADSEYNIDSLCSDIGMSRSVFFNRLKNLTNLSPNDYLRIKRLDCAAEFILGKQYDIDDISQMVGYKDVKHFRVLFRKRFGCMPAEYLNKQ